MLITIIEYLQVSIVLNIEAMPSTDTHSPQSEHQQRPLQAAWVERSKRCVYLFSVGVAFAFVLNLLQRQRKVRIFPPGVFGDILNSAWWVPPACGVAASECLHIVS